VGGAEVEVEEEEEVLKVEEVEGEDPLMTGDLQGEMTGEGEVVMVAEMEVVIGTTTEEESVVTGMEAEEEVVEDSRMSIMPTLG